MNPKEKYSTSIGQIVKWYFDPSKEEKREMHQPDSWKRIPFEQLPLLKQKLSYRFLKQYYPNSAEYDYYRCRGMLLHQTLKEFILNHLKNLECYFNDHVPYARLWFHLNREIYLALIKSFESLRISKPQMNEWKGLLFLESMNGARSHIRRIFKTLVQRLEKRHSLEHIVEDLTPLMQEQTMHLGYRGGTIHFKPDWIEFYLDQAVVLDYKSGMSRFKEAENLFQVKLFAWCFSRYRRVRIKQVEIHYLNQDRVVIIPWTVSTDIEIGQKIDQYISHLNPSISSTLDNSNQNPLTGLKYKHSLIQFVINPRDRRR